MRRIRQKILVFFVGLPILLYVVFEAKSFYFYFTHQRPPVRYVLPKDFQGWAVIEFNPTCPEPTLANQIVIYTLDALGKTCVDAQPTSGFAQDQVVYAGNLKQNLLQHPGTKMNFVWFDHKRKNQDKVFFVFYVGYEVHKKDQPQLFKDLQKKIQ